MYAIFHFPSIYPTICAHTHTLTIWHSSFHLDFLTFLFRQVNSSSFSCRVWTGPIRSWRHLNRTHFTLAVVINWRTADIFLGLGSYNPLLAAEPTPWTALKNTDLDTIHTPRATSVPPKLSSAVFLPKLSALVRVCLNNTFPGEALAEAEFSTAIFLSSSFPSQKKSRLRQPIGRGLHLCQLR